MADYGTSFLGRLVNSLINISNSNRVKTSALILLAVSAFIYYPDTNGDYDLWFHLRYGENFVKNFTWDIDHTMFSWTPADSDWKYVTWIGSSIFYIAYSIASITGLSILQWLIFLSVFFLYLRYIKSIGDFFDVSSMAGMMLVMVALNPGANMIKPELFTVLFFAIAVFIYFHAKSSQKNLFFLYPVLFLIWVNAHGGFVFGLLFIGIALCMEAAEYFFIKKSAMPASMLRRFALSSAASFIAVLINPYGIKYHTHLFRYLTSPEFIQGNVQTFAYFNMWNYLFPGEYIFRFINASWAMVLMLVIFIAVSIFAYRKAGHIDVPVLVVNLLFFYMGMKVGRTIIFFPVIWFFSVLYILKKADALSIKKKFAPAALAILLLCTGSIVYNTLCCMEYRSWFGYKSKEFVPAKEVEFIKNNRLPEPIFNDYLTGSYMLWSMYPDYKVFIDSRYGPYIKRIVPDYLYFRNNTNPETLSQFHERYEFNTVILHYNEMPVIWLFLNSPDWMLVYFDRVAVVLVRRSMENSISPQALTIDLGTARFKDVSNPITLADIFDIYRTVPLAPEIRLPLLRQVSDIFKRNVSDFYIGKKQIMENMEQVISAIEAEVFSARPQ